MTRSVYRRRILAISVHDADLEDALDPEPDAAIASPLVDTAALRHLAESIHVGDHGPYVSGPYEAFWTDQLIESGRHAGLSRDLFAVSSRLEVLRTICNKLEWLHDKMRAEDLEPIAWLYFAGSSDFSGE